MNRRRYLQVAGSIAALGLAGCSTGSSGTLATHVSDQPGSIGDFEACVVTITAIHVKPEDGDRETIDVEATEADLVELQGENSALVDETALDVGSYEFLQLSIGSVDATLKTGGDTTVTTPGEAPLKFNATFEIREGETTTFIADFTPVKQGARNQYVLQPVADETEVSYESETETATPTNATAS